MFELLQIQMHYALQHIVCLCDERANYNSCQVHPGFSRSTVVVIDWMLHLEQANPADEWQCIGPNGILSSLHSHAHTHIYS